ncbi:MAG TPA: DUF4162 domain-containing protein, partial [Membranihabitans sp.]|nr:DUF4162 domain-containing protein [Membranihabitans sp.]
ERPDLSGEVVRSTTRQGGVVIQFESLQEANVRMKQWMGENYLIQEFREILPTINDIFIKIVTSETVPA